MSKMPVTSNLNSSNLEARELLLRLPMITLLKFSVLISLNLYMKSKSAVEVLLQLSFTLDFCIVSLISILISELRDSQKTKLLSNLFPLKSLLGNKKLVNYSRKLLGNLNIPSYVR